MSTHNITISQETFEYLHKEVSGEYVGLNIVEAIVAEHKHLKYLHLNGVTGPALAKITLQDKNHEYAVPGEVKDYIGKSNGLIKQLAQTVADMSAMMMPFSGLTMMGLGMQANIAGKLLGEEIKPSESAFEGTVNIVGNIRRPMEDALKKMGDDFYKVGIESILLHKQQKFDQCAKDIRALLQKHHLLKDEDYVQKVDVDELK